MIKSGVVIGRVRIIRVILACAACAVILTAPAQVATVQPGESAQLLLSENAYNPIPSPDGKYIAYVATGWGGRFPNEVIGFGMGRSTLASDVELMDPSGKVLTRFFARGKFLAGWTEDSKAVICFRDGLYAILKPSGVSLEVGELPGLGMHPFYERVAFLSDIGRAIWLHREGAINVLRTSSETLVRLEGQAKFLM